MAPPARPSPPRRDVTRSSRRPASAAVGSAVRPRRLRSAPLGGGGEPGAGSPGTARHGTVRSGPVHGRRRGSPRPVGAEEPPGPGPWGGTRSLSVGNTVTRGERGAARSGGRGPPRVPAPARAGVLFFPGAPPGGTADGVCRCMSPFSHLRPCVRGRVVYAARSPRLVRLCGIARECRCSAASTAGLGKTSGDLPNLHRSVLALLGVAEWVMRKAPALGVALNVVSLPVCPCAALTVREATLNQKGQILLLISPEQQSETVKVLSHKWHSHSRVIR